MFGYRPPNISTLTTLNLSPSSVSHNSSRGRDGYRLSLMFRCRMRSPTSCICSTSSSVISTPANWASIASISSTRSSKSAPRSFVKCVSLVTNSMSTRSCLATRVRTSLMEKHSLKGGGCFKRCRTPDVHDQAPRFDRCAQQRANQCARKCDSDLKILECGIGITAIWFRSRTR